MRKLNSKFKTSFISEEGTFLQNKDYFAFAELDNYACYVVADGIDEDKELESAKIAVTTFIRDFTAKPTMNRFILRKYLKDANSELIRSSRNVRLKASITVVVTNYSKLIYSVIGNTRFYYFKDGYLKYKSKDQSLAQNLVDDEMIPSDAMSKHFERNNLSSYLGQDNLNKLYISKKIKLSDGDAFAILTKGIWENCDAKEIEDSLEGAKEPKEVTDNIEEMILSKQLKEIENYTLALTFVEKSYIDPKRSKKIKIAIIVAILLLLVIAIGVGAFIIHKNRKQEAIASVNEGKQNAEEYIKNGNIEKADEEYKKALDTAKKYKLKDDIDNLTEDYKYTEIVLDGDKDLEGKKYDDALDKYVLALEKSGEAEEAGSDYVLKKIDIAKKCVKVADLLTLADKQYDDNDLDGALKNYLDVKDLAVDYYLKDEKKEAMDKIQKIYDQKSADAKQKKADDDKAAADKKQAEDDSKKAADDAAKKAEDDKKAAEDKESKAIDLRKNGDLKYTAGDYVSAKMYYELAKKSFEDASDTSLADELVDKIALMDKKISETSDKKSEADKYAQAADAKYAAGDSASAKVLYILAKDAYNSLGDADNLAKVTEKITAIDKASAKS
ncbi:PP2C family protein-serine/threonine phosphatase [Clostridium beijerinckii]|uniref:PP2C family protein-serine/threonine phosphatase n=1 Tax=Clostridium beijerinckii TaxID=1520 RepID=UPI0014940675|nr:PP2C family serine/threonine-protein phosphatase [Clostridium beijerinckii]NOW06169.1 serine/threonine protein phosphatase PrpC [Clostridium beijerinckii]NYC00687.1 serine/threonine protein phosphatase PrpC [Clostridium beijerinckii]